jgi:uncharacterized membrane protein YcjF (UPF0283 family)
MLWLVWAALAFLLLVIALGGVHVVREGFAFWRTLKAFTALMGRAVDAVSARADELARKAGSVDPTGLTDATARLQRSLAYARIVADASGDAWATISGIRGSVPRK